MHVVACTDLSGKEPHRQVGVGKIVTPRSLGDVMVRTLDRNTIDVGSILSIGIIFPIFTTLKILVSWP